MEMRSLFQHGDFEGALSILEKDVIKNDNKAQLLYFFERGMVFFAQKKFYPAITQFEKALELQRKLYTVSISKKVATQIVNEHQDIYYGARYEHSLLYLYLIQSYLGLYQEGIKEEIAEDNKVVSTKNLSEKERLLELGRARSTLLLWDTFLQESTKEHLGKAVYKDDLMAKLFGAYIHLSMNRSEDRQIALQLLKDAKKVLMRYYNNYRTFNSSFKEFQENYKNFEQLSEEQVKKQFVKPTKMGEQVVGFIDELIRNNSSSKKPTFNTLLNFDFSLIPLKEAKEFNIGFNTVVEENGPNGQKTLNGVNLLVISAFASNILGLALPTAMAATAFGGISFELPEIKNSYQYNQCHLQIWDKKRQAVVQDIWPMPLDPIGDLAEQDIAENSKSLYLRVGARVGMKHLAAIVAAYATYQMIIRADQSDASKFMARNAAVLEYVLASRAIAASETADLRQWVTLPALKTFQPLKLKIGDYEVKKVSEKGELSNIGSFSVSSEDKVHFFNFHLL